MSIEEYIVIIIGLIPFLGFWVLVLTSDSDLKGCTHGLFKWHDWQYKSSYEVYSIERIRKLSENMLGTSMYETNKRYECRKCGKIKTLTK
jgi:hypothetical protein